MRRQYQNQAALSGALFLPPPAERIIDARSSPARDTSAADGAARPDGKAMSDKKYRLGQIMSQSRPRQLGNLLLNGAEAKLGRSRIRSRPIFLDLVLTRACNLACTFCIAAPTLRPARWLSWDLYQRIAAELFPYAAGVRFCSGGEPLLYPQVREALALARRHRVPTDLLSNGMLLDAAAQQWMVEDGSVTTLGISFDAATAPTLQRIRKGASFDRILANVEGLTRKKADAGAELPRIIMRFTAMRSTIEELPAVFPLCRQAGIEKVFVGYLNVANAIDPAESLFHHQDLAAEVFAAARRSAEETGVGVDLPLLPRDDHGERRCQEPWRFCQVDTDGAVRFCYKAWRQAAGFYEEGFEKIWRGELYRSLRATVNSPDPVFPYCRICSLRRGMGEEASHLHQPESEAYLLPGLEEFQTPFNRREEENREAHRERRGG